MKQLTDTAPTRAEFRAIYDKATKKGATKDDMRALQKAVASHADYGRAFDLAEMAIAQMIKGMPADPVGRVIAVGRTEALRNELSGDSPTPLERLLIDQVILSYMHVNMVEHQHTALFGESNASMQVIEFWERRLTACQSRYLRAIETLARVRRLLRLPGPQVNINLPGGQQVNIAGDART